ncbi:hypothetical protein [Nonomuraea sp. NPDC050310]|uniref:hypothetical protein n=1 Tax=Nonomuraea sp. NPDC050310 TaxID=3154935 RepID=UPI0033F69CFC
MLQLRLIDDEGTSDSVAVEFRVNDSDGGRHLVLAEVSMDGFWLCLDLLEQVGS